MAHVLYIPDGTKEVVYGNSREDFHNSLHDIIKNRLGYEAADLFEEVSNEKVEQVEGDDYEAIADGYLSMLNNAVEELDAIIAMFKKPRLNRQELESSIRRLRRDINANI